MTSNGRRNRFRGGRGQGGPKFEPVEYQRQQVDELLELIYILKEAGGEITIEKLKEKHEDEGEVDVLLNEMAATGLVSVGGKVITFSETGEKEAEKLIRAHRLAERLLTDVLLVEKEQAVETQACAMEHILNPEIVDNICTILGHPRSCPHGHEIPPGECCEEMKRRAAPIVRSLNELRSGESGKILYIETTDHERLDKLTTFGILPGSVVRVHQRQPSLVLIMGETQLALDTEIAEHIHVVKLR